MSSALVLKSFSLAFSRLNRYKNFKDGLKRILVATDLVGRGIDIERVNIVINYDMPENADSYLHRVSLWSILFFLRVTSCRWLRCRCAVGVCCGLACSSHPSLSHPSLDVHWPNQCSAWFCYYAESDSPDPVSGCFSCSAISPEHLCLFAAQKRGFQSHSYPSTVWNHECSLRSGTFSLWTRSHKVCHAAAFVAI